MYCIAVPCACTHRHRLSHSRCNSSNLLCTRHTFSQLSRNCLFQGSRGRCCNPCRCLSCLSAVNMRVSKCNFSDSDRHGSTCLALVVVVLVRRCLRWWRWYFPLDWYGKWGTNVNIKCAYAAQQFPHRKQGACTSFKKTSC